MTGLIVLTAMMLVAPAQAGEEKLAIVVSAPELDADTAFAIETKLLAAAEQVPGVRLVLREETRIHVQAMRAMGDECNALPCIGNVGAAANAKKVLFAHVSPRAVEALLVEAGRGRQLGSMSTAAPEGVSEATASRIVRALLTPNEMGSLVVLVEPEDAALRIDGEPAVPGTRVEGLAVGPHVVEVTRDGYIAYRDEVTISPGGLVTHDARLELAPVTTALSPFLLGGIGAFGAGVLAGAAGIGLALTPALLPLGTAAEAEDTKARNGSLLAGSLFAGGAAVVAVVTGAALTTYSFME